MPNSAAVELDRLRVKILGGETLSESEAYSLSAMPRRALHAVAAEVTAAMSPRRFDSCSIVNARSGRCSENCKWCAQSAHYATGCHTYSIVSEDECLALARHNAACGIRRFSFVASGRAVRGQALCDMAALAAKVKADTGIYTCASMGLLTREELQTLWNAGVRRYHCNLETAPSYFATLCTTHTVEDKLATIASAREIGFEICSGGIIGMGETVEQRIEFALTLRRAAPVSIPVNILQPIKGTPLQDTPPISDDEILDTVAFMRLIHPRTTIRFAGGRAGMASDLQAEAMRIGVNGAIMGDMLTTVGSGIADDIAAIRRAGYEF